MTDPAALARSAFMAAAGADRDQLLWELNRVTQALAAGAAAEAAALATFAALMASGPLSNPTCSVPEAAQLIGVSKSKVYELIAAGVLRKVEGIGAAARLRTSDVLAFIAGRKAA